MASCSVPMPHWVQATGGLGWQRTGWFCSTEDQRGMCRPTTSIWACLAHTQAAASLDTLLFIFLLKQVVLASCL